MGHVINIKIIIVSSIWCVFSEINPVAVRQNTQHVTICAVRSRELKESGKRELFFSWRATFIEY
jgi:hypothetical protein